HAFVLEGRADTRWPADLYLEGSDQHRDWFQSSLLESSGTRGRAPYDAVLTHGFTVTEAGEKMSKSLGNAVEPMEVIKESGAEILRLWAALVDYTEDQRIGKTILSTTSDAYRKLRNTIRYMLGALAGFAEAERVALADLPPLERFILHRLWELDGQVRQAYEVYEFQAVSKALLGFCQDELSSLFFDIRRDALYCDRPDSLRRRAARTVMDAVFERLTIWLAPLIPFTMEEAWTTRFPDAGSNCLRVFPETLSEWRDDAEAERWARLLEVKGAVNAALESARAAKEIGSSLEARPIVSLEGEREANFAVRAVSPAEFAAELFVTSSADISFGGAPERPVIAKAKGHKCARCWRVLPEVTAPKFLCERCDDAVAHWDAAHAREEA
ncbi:MAG: class I tRNA ligase family protein, partial [Caulobacteraceae bacterium]